MLFAPKKTSVSFSVSPSVCEEAELPEDCEGKCHFDQGTGCYFEYQREERFNLLSAAFGLWLLSIPLAIFATVAIKRKGLKAKLANLRKLGAVGTLKAIAIPLAAVVILHVFLFFVDVFTAPMRDSMSLDMLWSLMGIRMLVGLVFLPLYAWIGYNMAKALSDQSSSRFENAFSGFIGGLIVGLITTIPFITGFARSGLDIITLLIIFASTMAFPIILAVIGGLIAPVKRAQPESLK